MSDRNTRLPVVRTLKVDDLLKIYDGIISSADEILLESQIAGPEPIPDVPDGAEVWLRYTAHKDPLPPSDMTEVPPLILGKLFSLFQNWTNYVAAEVTRAKCIKEIQERKQKVIKSALTLYFREQGVTVALIDDHINTDKAYVDVEAAALSIKVFYETAKGREEQLRRTLNNLSREQTRRSDEMLAQLHDDRGGQGPSVGPGSKGPKGPSSGRRVFKR